MRRVSRIHGNDTSKRNPPLNFSCTSNGAANNRVLSFRLKAFPPHAQSTALLMCLIMSDPYIYASGTVEPKWKHCGNSYIFYPFNNIGRCVLLKVDILTEAEPFIFRPKLRKLKLVHCIHTRDKEEKKKKSKTCFFLNFSQNMFYFKHMKLLFIWLVFVFVCDFCWLFKTRGLKTNKFGVTVTLYTWQKHTVW